MSDDILNPHNLFKKYIESYNLIAKSENTRHGPRILEISKYLFDEEENRRKRIDTTASNFLSIIAVVAALIIAMAGLIFNKGINLDDSISFLTLILYFISLIYLFCAYINSLSIFGIVPRYYPDPNDLVPNNSESENQFSLRIGVTFLYYTVENYKINNRQQHKIHNSRVLIRNAIVALLMAGILLGIISIKN